MKLSAAILRGVAMGGFQVKGKMFAFDANGSVIGSCALGAAALGTGLVPMPGLGRYGNGYVVSHLEEVFGRAECARLYNQISDGNDLNGLTREQIAADLQARGL